MLDYFLLLNYFAEKIVDCYDVFLIVYLFIYLYVDINSY